MNATFDEIANRMPRLAMAPPEDPETTDPEDIVAFELSAWAADPLVERVFLPWINTRIEALDDEEALCVKDHAALLLAKGRRLEAKYLRDEFYKWRGTPRKERP